MWTRITPNTDTFYTFKINKISTSEVKFYIGTATQIHAAVVQPLSILRNFIQQSLISKIRDWKDLWHLSRLEIRLNTRQLYHKNNLIQHHNIRIRYNSKGNSLHYCMNSFRSKKDFKMLHQFVLTDRFKCLYLELFWN